VLELSSLQSIVQLSIATNSALVGLYLIFEREERSISDALADFKKTVTEAKSKEIGSNDADLISLEGVISITENAHAIPDNAFMRKQKWAALWLAFASVPLLAVFSILGDVQVHRGWALAVTSLLAPIALALGYTIVTGFRAHTLSTSLVPAGRLAMINLQRKINPQQAAA